MPSSKQQQPPPKRSPFPTTPTGDGFCIRVTKKAVYKPDGQLIDHFDVSFTYGHEEGPHDMEISPEAVVALLALSKARGDGGR